MQTFSPKVYGASPQNWQSVQDLRGVTYFANTDGVLEYDGVSWRRIKVKNGAALALGVDEAGTIYVGGQSEFGYLRADSSGSLEYVSLVDSVAPGDRKFGNVWSVLSTSKGIYFSSNERLFRWSPGTMKVWRPRSKFGIAHVLDGAVYVTESGVGLERVRGDQLDVVPGGDHFAHSDIAGLAFMDGSLVAMTRDAMFRQTSTGFEAFESSAAPLLKEDGIYSSLMLPDGRLAIGTLKAGLVLLDSTGQLEHVIGKSQGLDAERVTSIYAGRQGGIWLTLYNGLVRLQMNLSRFDEHSGLKGNVYALARQDGVLYAGTHLGVFRLDAKPGQDAVFEAVPGSQGSTFAVLPSKTGLLVGDEYGLMRISGGRASRELPLDLIYDLYLSTRDSNVLYAAGRRGLFRLRWNGHAWVKDAEVPSGGLEFRSVVEEDDGAVWVATRTDVLQIRFAPHGPEVVHYDAAAGAPAGWKFIYRVQGRLVFATPAGLKRFDGRRFVPDNTFGTDFANRPVLWLREDALHRIWISGDGYHGYLTRAVQGYEWHPMPLLATGIEEFYACAIDDDGTVWAAGSEGWLARYHSTLAPEAQTASLILRRARVLGASMSVFSGGGRMGVPIRLPYRDNDLRFEFALPFYDEPNAVEYQVRLDGLDRDWSAWTTETRKDYTNLWEGNYTFHVKARTPYGAETHDVTFGFAVLPPWYRTWWAYLLYAFVAAAALSAFVRWRLAQLAQQNRRLEAVVAERTAELRREHEALQVQERKTENLLLNILPTSVADELRTTGEVAPMLYDEVTVCFTDFVGFTLSSEKLPAGELVSALNEYFTTFDEIVTRYGLEKLKTIGDAYMFVSGLPQSRRGHAVDAVLAALEIVEAVRRLGKVERPVRWQVRVGLHTGPVVAGVVGVKKFAFDIWGNTVNFAARMESSSAPGRINLSPRTYACVRDFIECEPRGIVRTKKEQWEVEMYYARQIRPELVNGGGAVPAAFLERYRLAFGEEPRAFPAMEPSGATVAETSA